VQPHVPLPAADALRVAQLQALKPLLAEAAGAGQRAAWQDRIRELEQAAR